MIENLISFSLATLILAISPGPDNIYVLTQSLSNGIKSGVATTLGLISGCIVHTSLLAFGVSAIITASEPLFYVVKVVGSLYLIFLAYKVWRSDSTIHFSSETSATENHWQLFKRGVVMNLVNPKVMVFFLAFFPGFLWNPAEGTVEQFYILGLTFMMVSFLVFSGIAILAGVISSIILKYKRIGWVLKWLQILVFLGIAIFILLP